MARKRRTPTEASAPAAPGEATVRIVAPNVWSDKGKHYQGDTVVLSNEAAQFLIGRGQAKEI